MRQRWIARQCKTTVQKDRPAASACPCTYGPCIQAAPQLARTGRGPETSQRTSPHEARLITTKISEQSAASEPHRAPCATSCLGLVTFDSVLLIQEGTTNPILCTSVFGLTNGGGRDILRPFVIGLIFPTIVQIIIYILIRTLFSRSPCALAWLRSRFERPKCRPS